MEKLLITIWLHEPYGGLAWPGDHTTAPSVLTSWYPLPSCSIPQKTWSQDSNPNFSPNGGEKTPSLGVCI